MIISRPRGGWLHVIYGCMFAGKSEELIREVVREQIAKRIVRVFKPKIDTRDGVFTIKTHSGASIPCIPINEDTPEDIYHFLDSVSPEHEVIAIDEAQFFNRYLTLVCLELTRRGHTVIVAGLNLDFRGQPFGPMRDLIVRADSTRQLHAVCIQCGRPATRTMRFTNGKPSNIDEDVIVIGAEQTYEARCNTCHQVGEVGEHA